MKKAQSGITEDLLAKQAFKESMFNEKAVSNKNAKGISQIRKTVLNDYLKANKLDSTKVDLFNPEHNIKIQRWYMNNLYNSSFANKPNQTEQNRLAKTLAAYNYGRGNVSKLLQQKKNEGKDIYNSYDWIESLPEETKDYVNKLVFQKDTLFNKQFEEAYKTHPNIKYFKKQKNGGIIEDNRGQWAHPGKVTKINSPNITMEGVDYPVLGVSDQGDTKLMLPNQNYKFKGSSVTEYPMAKSGIHIKKQNKGLLHKNLGVPQDEKIPASKLKVKESDSAAVKKRKVFAQNAKKWHKGQYGDQLPLGSANPPIDYSTQYDLQPYQSQGVFDMYGSEQAQQYLPQQGQQSQGFMSKMLGKAGGWGGIIQGAGNAGAGMAMGDQQQYGGPSTAQNVVGQFGPWGKAISTVSQFATQTLNKSNNKVVGGITNTIFDPGSAWTNKDLSTKDRILGGINPFYGGMKAAEAREKREKQGKKIKKLVNKAASLQGKDDFNRQYIRPEDQLIDINTTGSSYGSGTNYLQDGGTVPKTKEVRLPAANYFITPDGQKINNKYGATEFKGTVTREQYLDALNNPDKYSNDHPLMNSYGVYQDMRKEFRENPKLMSVDLGYLSESKLPQGLSINGKLSPVQGVGNTGDVIYRKVYSDEPELVPIQQPQETPISGIEASIPPKSTEKFVPKNPTDWSQIKSYAGKSKVGGYRYGARGGKGNVAKGSITKRKGEHGATLDGELETFWGGKAQPMSYNPYLPGGGESIEFIGNSHSEKDRYGRTGIGVSFGKKSIEVEGGEPAVKLQNGGDAESLTVFGDMKIPSYGVSELEDPKAKGKKFKSYIKDLNKKENKNSGIIENSVFSASGNPMSTAFDKLKMSTDKAMITGADMNLKRIANQKQVASSIQNAILDTANEFGINSADLAKGKITKLKKSDIAQNGKRITPKYAGDASSYYVERAAEPDNVVSVDTEQTDYPSYEPTTNWTDSAMTAFNTVLPYIRPVNKVPLTDDQLAGERYALSTNQLEPVQAQKYVPLLDQFTNISLQDQLNANQADFNSLLRSNPNNPAVQGTLAAQKYAANSGVLGEQFRLNQSSQIGTFNKNRATLNDATLKNLAIMDQQYTRQSQAKANTKAVAKAALESIGNKIAQNKLENAILAVDQQRYNYRFTPNGTPINMNPLFQPNIPQVGNDYTQIDENGNVVYQQEYTEDRDSKGRLKGTKSKTKTTTSKKENGGIIKSFKSY